jgi:hypothetical protein
LIPSKDEIVIASDCRAALTYSAYPRDGWLPIALAPTVEISNSATRVTGIEALGFPCRRKSGVW